MENMAVSKDFWKNKSVFITGHTGFKGGWLSLWLQKMGASVCGYALAPPTNPNLFETARVGDGMHSIIDNVLDGDSLSSAMSSAKPDIAFHFAAQPIVRASYLDPAGTFAVNVMGTVNFLESVRRTPSVQAAIVVTSDKCYENENWWDPCKETDPMGGHDPYSSSKGCAELVVKAYRRSFFSGNHISLASVRAGNVIGGGDWAPDRLLPDIIRAFESGRPLILRNPESVRPWQHVLDPLRGYLILAEKLWNKNADFAEGWNFGPSDEPMPVIEVVRRSSSLWGDGASWKAEDAGHPHEAKYLKLDSSLALSRLGWVNLLKFDQAIEWSISWYRTFLKGNHDMHDYTIGQIEKYEKLIKKDA
jgi:CDP-glucose 4,6-dehydratase